ncbi:hypothetical protein IDJ77_05330 [Mucilaginibacter sp. ZT4R22]|uniref:Lipoprotein n=1 Tax=Mucilaginibacter pankratovii TaxID=2772110 RepID=A0ABR7WM47_9SPHI|nr:hypothetical protein [Mucilaginibacter pankratovii]MBD1363228.1 hypothetical protein [Mucilaginibacter pankratovii]
MRKIDQLTVGCFMLLTLVLGCAKDANKPVASGDGAKTTVPRAALPQSAFNLWKTCNGTPYNISGTNGIAIPVGNCSTDIDAAQQKVGQNATGMQFNGAFKGGSNAYSGASEEAVFVCDNVTQWNGNEMGFVKTLENNDLKAYLQGGASTLPR